MSRIMRSGFWRSLLRAPAVRHWRSPARHSSAAIQTVPHQHDVLSLARHIRRRFFGRSAEYQHVHPTSKATSFFADSLDKLIGKSIQKSEPTPSSLEKIDLTTHRLNQLLRERQTDPRSFHIAPLSAEAVERHEDLALALFGNTMTGIAHIESQFAGPNLFGAEPNVAADPVIFDGI